jgi:hypothetical protein
MIVLLRENYSKLLLIHFFYYGNFVTCYSQIHDISYIKLVEGINI